MDTESEFQTKLKIDNNLLLTPLIDIIFLILIFFIINYQTLRYNETLIELPTTEGVQGPEKQLASILIVIDEDLNISLNDDRVHKSELRAKLDELISSQYFSLIRFQADKTVNYQELISIFDILGDFPLAVSLESRLAPQDYAP